MAEIKVAFLVANGVEESEFVVTHDILNRAGIDTIVYSESEDERIQTNKGLRIRVHGNIDSLISAMEQEPGIFDALIIPGGPGHKLVDENKETDRLLDLFFNNDKVVGAICAAPTILGKRNFLNGKNVTVYPSYAPTIKGGKVDLSKMAIIDGNIVTGRDYLSSYEFGFALVERLLGKDKATQLRNEA